MSNEISFTVPGVPVAQPRQRHRVVQMGGHAVATNYTPRTSPVQQYKAAVALAAQAAGLPGELWQGPVALEVWFYLPRPRRLMRKRDPGGPIYHTGKPDSENLLKALQDALTGVLWRDDAQVCQVTVVKFYHEKEGRPRTDIRAWHMATEWMTA